MILERTSSVTFDQFFEDAALQDAVLYRLAVIGEAAVRLRGSSSVALPDLPWHELIGLRNRVIHQYDDLDFSIVWSTLEVDIPALAWAIESLLQAD